MLRGRAGTAGPMPPPAPRPCTPHDDGAAHDGQGLELSPADGEGRVEARRRGCRQRQHQLGGQVHCGRAVSTGGSAHRWRQH